MTDFFYTKGIPNGPNNPSNDQPLMKVNNDNIDDLIAVDHQSFNLNNGGFHNLIHQIPQGTWNAVTRTGAPAATLGFNEVCALNYLPDSTGAVTDTQLFNITGNGGVSQLTGNLANQEGWVWCGGILFQWGLIALANSGNPLQGTVTFKNRVAGAIPFPNNVFNIQLTLISHAGGSNTFPGGISVIDGTANKLEFQWNYSTGNSSYRFAYWFAIGQ